MSTTSRQRYAETVLDNLGGMLGEFTRDAEGIPKPLSDEMAAGVVVAQSNMAIAAALMLIAAELKDRP